MHLRVDCQPQRGSAEAEPSVIWFGSRRVPVLCVVDRWWGPTRRWWKVQTGEGAYVLRLEQDTGEWTLAAVVRT
ncbi:hypothetical protein [Ramlibacter tataouinensis]|uniref:hypothetical protein n=1 Tax=Ramlibacter tataouinensis TaxID=94132 RepID=UPI0002D292C8|nr:hypothetical protein [Ramlibacter tataouinensis]